MIAGMNIIVRMPNWIGDLVMATPILTDLRAAFPDAHITAMCKRPLCELLEKEESIDELFCFTKPGNDFLRREERDIIAKIRAGKHDLGILLTNSFSSAWWFWLGGVKRTVGYSGRFRTWMLTDPVFFQQGKEHLVDSYKRLLAPLGVKHSDTAPRLHFDKQEVQEAKTLLHRFGYKEGRKLIGINPGAAFGSAKCWPPERFRELTVRLLKETDAHIVFFGDASMKGLMREICQGLPERVIDLAGVSTLRELACLIKACNVLVTNDSGPSHIGDALGVPLVVLFGSTDEELTGPFRQRAGVINKKAKCSPCFKRTCPIDFRCMKEIGVEEVLERVLAHV